MTPGVVLLVVASMVVLSAVCCLAAVSALEAWRHSRRIERNLQRRAREEWALREVIRATATKYNGNN